MVINIKPEPQEPLNKFQADFSSPLEEVKKDPDGNFLHISTKVPKALNLINTVKIGKGKNTKEVKKEVLRMKIRSIKKLPEFSEFQCKICSVYLSCRDSLKFHTERHYNPANYDCKKCGRVFEVKAKFEIHKCGRQKCKHCGKIYENNVYLKSHILRAHEIELNFKLLQCDCCGKKFKYKLKLQTHLKRCRREIFTCDCCGKNFSNKHVLGQHVFYHKNPKTNCKICGLEMKIYHLRAHMNNVHENEEEKCEICGKKFKNKFHLKVHRRIHDKKFECNICHLKVPSKSHLTQHMKFHINPEALKCEICGHQAKLAGHLKNHMRTHKKMEDRKFGCNQCDYRTDHKTDINGHLKRHEKLKEKLKRWPEAVQCEKCISVLKNRQSYLRINHDLAGRPQCDQCQLSFKTKQTLTKHLKVQHLQKFIN